MARIHGDPAVAVRVVDAEILVGNGICDQVPETQPEAGQIFSELIDVHRVGAGLIAVEDIDRAMVAEFCLEWRQRRGR